MKRSRPLKPYLVPVYANQQFFADVKELHPIPSDCIIDKTLTGFGATYSEISYRHRNSIIVMPNIAIIEAKSQKHQAEFNTFGLWGDTSSYVLKSYLRDKNYPKKILTTPESYARLKKAILETGGNPENDYFMLIDESHKLTKDVGFRNKIVEAMNDFFLFKKKALISATPLMPSDPRFIRNNFRYLKVEPNYPFKKDIDVIHVSNMVTALKRYFTESKESQYFIFFNSIEGIRSLIEKLFIEDGDYSIYCSRESSDNLLKINLTNVYYELNEFSKYNFFTSSFYNGLDIELAIKPDVILITEIKAAHTAIDPLTDSIQIVGRFRNGYRKGTHFYTTNWKIPSYDSLEATYCVEAEYKVYQAVKSLQIANPKSKKEGCYDNVYTQSIQRSAYSKFITDGITDYFKIDNYLADERVKSYYANAEAIKAAYADKTQQCLAPIFKSYVLISDKDDKLNLRDGKRYSKENNKLVATTLELLKDYPDSEEYKEAIRYFNQKALYMVQAYFKIGYEAMESLGFKKRDIEKAVLKADLESQINIYPVYDAVHTAFKIGSFTPNSKITEKLTKIYTEFDIADEVKPKHILLFFECGVYSKKIDGTTVRGYILLKQKQLGHPDYQRT